MKGLWIPIRVNLRIIGTARFATQLSMGHFFNSVSLNGSVTRRNSSMCSTSNRPGGPFRPSRVRA